MSTHKYIDRICCIVLSLMLVLTVLFINGSALGIKTEQKSSLQYEDKLFDTSRVHTIDIQMDDWNEFIESCEDEEYSLCTVVIDNETFKNVGIRAKGNTSLSSVSAYGNDRYSFKIEFDHYYSSENYYGLDKLNLNNIIQDNTYMKDYLAYQMMGYFGVNSPLCSYTYITVNGEDWGLYLAVEGVEDSFLERNFGNNFGELYKPDSVSMGGGQGNGGKFNMDDFENDQNGDDSTQGDNQRQMKDKPQRPDNSSGQDNNSNGMRDPSDGQGGNAPGGFMDRNTIKGSSDVSLIYTDDDTDSYSNIFDNAKTDISKADKKRLIASLKKLNENTDIEDIVNIDEVIRYFVVHNFVCNFDSYTGSMIHNYYLYEKNGQMSMIPWDYNLAFGTFQSSDATGLVNYPIDTPVSGGTVDSRPMLSWIFSSEEYTQLYHEYFQKFITDYFDSGYFENMIDSVESMISPYVEKDPTKFCTYEEYEKGISTLKQFCLLRAESVDSQLEGTIPSTSDGQKSDNSALIDASSITITDMGTMGVRGGIGGDKGQMGPQGNTQNTDNSSGQQQPPDNSAGQQQPPDSPPGGNGDTSGNSPQGSAPSGDNNNQQGGFQIGQGGAPPQQGMPQGGQNMPDGNTSDNNPPGQAGGNGPNMQGASGNIPQQTSTLGMDTWILLGSSAMVLAVGLIFAIFYRRRR